MNGNEITRNTITANACTTISLDIRYVLYNETNIC